MIFNNFYIKAPVGMLEIPIELTAFDKGDGTYYTIPEYLATYNHTVDRFTTDGTMFLKGFGFTIKVLDELRAKLADYGLTEDTNFFILSQPEAVEELSKPEWQEVSAI